MSRHLSRIKSWEDLAREAKFQPCAMAALCSISLRQLERFFLTNFHRTPKTWTRELRCNLARNLLAEGWTNKAVTRELSFSNDSHLCHEIRRHYGLPPRGFAPIYLGGNNGRHAHGGMLAPRASHADA